MKKQTIILTVSLLTVYASAQKHYDTTLYRECTITKIERSMKVGYWLTVVSGKDTVIAAMRTVPKATREMVGKPSLIGKEQFELLKKNKL